MDKTKIIISTIYIFCLLIQNLCNRIKNNNNKEKRCKLALLEYKQKMLNILIHEKFHLNEELEMEGGVNE